MSSTDARIEANRANAQRSTGPRSPEGKAASSRNALRHGAYATDATLLTVPGSAAQRYLAAFTAQFSPATAVEETLVRRMAACAARTDVLDQALALLPALDERRALVQHLQEHYDVTGPSANLQDRLNWSAALRRYDGSEVTYERDPDPALDPDPAACAVVYALSSPRAVTLMRQHDAADRRFLATLHELERLQAARRATAVAMHATTSRAAAATLPFEGAAQPAGITPAGSAIAPARGNEPNAVIPVVSIGTPTHASEANMEVLRPRTAVTTTRGNEPNTAEPNTPLQAVADLLERGWRLTPPDEIIAARAHAQRVPLVTNEPNTANEPVAAHETNAGVDVRNVPATTAHTMPATTAIEANLESTAGDTVPPLRPRPDARNEPRPGVGAHTASTGIANEPNPQLTPSAIVAPIGSRPTAPEPTAVGVVPHTRLWSQAPAQSQAPARSEDLGHISSFDFYADVLPPAPR
jgi:hypothetical protein